LHLRYLVKTKLPKIKSDLALEYEQKYKNLTKAEKLNAQVQELEEKIEKAKEHLKWAQSLKDDEKLDYLQKNRGYERPTWQKVIDNGAAKNFNNSEAEFDAFMRNSDEKAINNFNALNIRGNLTFIESMEKSLIKLRAKLQKLV
jgi:hypothetical protein